MAICSYFDRLPLETTIEIARAPGTDALRLRREQVPIDLSSRIIFENALIEYETHQPYASIRRPLREMKEEYYASKAEIVDGKEKDDLEHKLNQELIEREELFWQHEKGYPRKQLDASGLIPLDDGLSADSVVFSQLKGRYLVYEQIVEYECAIQIVDLISNQRWIIELQTPALALTITDHIFAFVEEQTLYAMKLDTLDESVPMLQPELMQKINLHRVSNFIMGMAGQGDTIALLYDNGDLYFYDVMELRLTKVLETRGHREGNKYTIATNRSFFLYMAISKDGEVHSLRIQKLEKDGRLLSEALQRLENVDMPEQPYLLHCGDGWTLVQTGLDSFAVDLTSGQNMPVLSRIWKGKMYSFDGSRWQVSLLDLKEKCPLSGRETPRRSVWPGRKIGHLDTSHVGNGGKPWEFLIGDSFIVIMYEKGTAERFRYSYHWAAFSFEDLDGSSVDDLLWKPAEMVAGCPEQPGEYWPVVNACHEFHD